MLYNETHTKNHEQTISSSDLCHKHHNINVPVIYFI
jgi:hypothetical protein